MGVTLERVQNKFACIIGELCSEPVILSQFAIWVDLRIAEYKAKGAISLDCSGCDPDPAWLKGHVTQHHKPKAREKTMSLAHLPQDGDGPGMSFPSNLETCERLSPDIVVVKEEAGSEHEENCAVYSPHFRRKRNISSTSGGDDPCQSNVLRSKIPRLAATSESPPLVFEPVNESLMSIIGNSDQGGHEVSTEPEGTVTVPHVNNLFMNRYHTPASSEDTVTVNVDSQEAYNNSRGESGSAVDRNPLFSACYGDIVTHSHTRTPNIAALRSRILNQDQKASSTVRNMVAAVASFERWLSASHPEETRCVEHIPPPELDPYLADFFLNVKQPSGQDYKVDSFRQIRYNLDKFLQDHSYPCTLTDSSEFKETRLAFRKRLAYLGNVDALRQHGAHLFSSSVPSSTSDSDVTPSEKTADSSAN
ncbi:uncharacterized protein LOC135463295 isoform X1 [Liolophura sinensis]|uniref:uncharacterized protein LOC135463295 isoform X1 n=1 Tax=Liolophura sinensis TaxID=3198878 RepID=UPI003158204F